MEHFISLKEIQNKIFTIRNLPVMLDHDLAEIYNVETKRISEQVKRNSERFPISYRFQLTQNETDKLVAKCDRLSNLKHSSVFPHVFTEQGVAMLSTVLKSETAIRVSIQIIDAFVEMRRLIYSNDLLMDRIEKIEFKQSESDLKFEELFQALASNQLKYDSGIFFEGQLFDAYLFASELVKSAKKSIILIDNYIDESVLNLLSKRDKQVEATIFTNNINKILKLDLQKHNAQYPEINIKLYPTAHDRFMIIDQCELYHIGASLKDLGKKWFAFSKMNKFIKPVLDKLDPI